MQPIETTLTAEARREEMVATAQRLGEYYRHISLEYATLKYPNSFGKSTRPAVPPWLAKTYETR